VRIQFSMQGGFAALPGLRRPVTLDLDALPADVAGVLRAARTEQSVTALYLREQRRR
jgi:hypothetical protein